MSVEPVEVVGLRWNFMRSVFVKVLIKSIYIYAPHTVIVFNIQKQKQGKNEETETCFFPPSANSH